MGGYNTLCEILSQGTPSLIVPRENPRQEQLLRARAFKAQGLIDCIPWSDLSPQVLREKLEQMLQGLPRYQQAIADFKLEGIETIRQRLAAFRTTDPSRF